MRDHPITPTGALIWTIALVAATAGPGALPGILATVAGLMVAMIRARSLSPFRQTLRWSLPICLPLLSIHSLLNPAFVETARWGWLPFREAGFAYGSVRCTTIVAFVVAAVIWRGTTREAVVRSAIRAHVPTQVVVLLALTASTFSTIQRRIPRTLDAQRARGVIADRAILSRIRALVAVIVPVVITGLVEADVRAKFLRARGLGDSSMAVIGTDKRPLRGVIADASISGAAIAIGWLLRG